MTGRGSASRGTGISPGTRVEGERPARRPSIAGAKGHQMTKIETGGEGRGSQSAAKAESTGEHRHQQRDEHRRRQTQRRAVCPVPPKHDQKQGQQIPNAISDEMTLEIR